MNELESSADMFYLNNSSNCSSDQSVLTNIAHLLLTFEFILSFILFPFACSYLSKQFMGYNNLFVATFYKQLKFFC